MIHKTVLLNEAIENLNLSQDKIFFDGTLGGAGHTMKVCEDFNGKVKIIATDKNIDALNNAGKLFSNTNCDYKFELADFREIEQVLAKNNVKNVDAILLDLGTSSDEIELSGRGFSFKKDEPLLMTFSKDTENIITAETILNFWKEEIIADILYGYADEIYSRKIAKAIVETRKIKEIKTTFELVEIIKNAVPKGYQNGKLHFATKTFQALRIAVNDEIGALKEVMEKGWNHLSKNGRMAIITFHSVEDREVKNFFRYKAKDKVGILINKKPIVPKRSEILENGRSRSAKLRVIEKI